MHNLSMPHVFVILINAHSVTYYTASLKTIKEIWISKGSKNETVLSTVLVLF